MALVVRPAGSWQREPGQARGGRDGEDQSSEGQRLHATGSGHFQSTHRAGRRREAVGFHPFAGAWRRRDSVGGSCDQCRRRGAVRDRIHRRPGGVGRLVVTCVLAFPGSNHRGPWSDPAAWRRRPGRLSKPNPASSFMCHSSMAFSWEIFASDRPVVGKGCGSHRCLDTLDINRGRVDSVEQQGDGAGGIGLKGEPRQIVHQADLLHVGLGTGRIQGHGCADPGLPDDPPTHATSEALFQVADAGEVLVLRAPSCRTERAAEIPSPVRQPRRECCVGLETPDLRRGLLRRTLEEQFSGKPSEAFSSENQDSGAGPQAADPAGR